MVMSPKFYQQQIESIGIEGLEIAPRSLADAMSLKIKLRRDQRMLQQIRYNIRMDIRVIRREYIDKMNSLQESSKMSRDLNKKLAKKAIMAKKNLIEERDDKITPYDALERLVDYYLDEIESSKEFLDSFLEKGVET